MADLTIDGNEITIPLLSLKRKADFLDKYAERTSDGILHRELIGVYFNYQLVFGQSANTADYQALWNLLTEPTEFHTLIVPDEDGYLTYVAYFSNVSDEFAKVLGSSSRVFRNLTVNFISKEPCRIPS